MEAPSPSSQTLVLREIKPWSSRLFARHVLFMPSLISPHPSLLLQACITDFHAAFSPRRFLSRSLITSESLFVRSLPRTCRVWTTCAPTCSLVWDQRSIPTLPPQQEPSRRWCAPRSSWACRKVSQFTSRCGEGPFSLQLKVVLDTETAWTDSYFDVPPLFRVSRLSSHLNSSRECTRLNFERSPGCSPLPRT